VSHSTCTHQGWVDSWLLVVESPSFCHNLCCKCPNGSCEAIFDIYISIAFQWHEERVKARCFDPCNQTLKFWESRRTPKSSFRECECHPHTLPKVGLQHHPWNMDYFSWQGMHWLITPPRRQHHAFRKGIREYNLKVIGLSTCQIHVPFYSSIYEGKSWVCCHW